jgi:Methyltransferase domain
MTAEVTGYPAQRFGSHDALALPVKCRRYLASGFRTVHGWVPALALLQVARFLQLQHSFGIRGPTCEIGIHHGRMFILMQLLTEPDELSVGIDLHERAQLLRNLRAHGGEPARVRLIFENSLNVSAARVLAACCGKPRLFSVDGGRTVDTTHHDLTLAHDTLCSGGVVVVDDYFQERWPEVSEGVCRFMLREGGLYPVAIGGNKLFLTNSADAAQAYRARLAELFQGQTRNSLMFGEPVLQIQRLTLRRRLSRTPLWQAIRRRVL